MRYIIFGKIATITRWIVVISMVLWLGIRVCWGMCEMPISLVIPIKIHAQNPEQNLDDTVERMLGPFGSYVHRSSVFTRNLPETDDPATVCYEYYGEFVPSWILGEGGYIVAVVSIPSNKPSDANMRVFFCNSGIGIWYGVEEFFPELE